MSPPDLTGDTPVADIVHPGVKGIVPGIRVELDSFLPHRRHSLVRQGPYRDKPLLGGGGLNHGGAAVALTHSMVIVFDLVKKTHLIQILDDLLTAGKTIHTSILASLIIHDAVVIHDLNSFQIMAQTDLVVVPVMGRRDLEGTGSELPLDMMI